MAIKTTTPLDTTHSGNEAVGFITVDRELETWDIDPVNGIYAGKQYIITTMWRGTSEGARHIMTGRSSTPTK